MGLIDRATVDRIYAAADIVEIIGDYVTLKRKGVNYQACCPFHNEKTPSFVVSPSKGVFKCFGCGKAGNAVTFVMEREGRVVVAGRINHEQCPQYAAVPWTEPETPDEQVLVLHTLVSDPLVAGHGCGTEFVAFYEQYAREHGCTWLRIDTNARNVSARRLYARLGYREVDIVPGEFNGIPDVQLVCMEKRV